MYYRTIDVFPEWRTFNNDGNALSQKPASRVGGAENPALQGADLHTRIGPGTGSASFDDKGNAKYKNRNQVSIKSFIFCTLFITILLNYE